MLLGFFLSNENPARNEIAYQIPVGLFQLKRKKLGYFFVIFAL